MSGISDQPAPSGPSAAEVARNAVAGSTTLCARTAETQPEHVGIYATDPLGAPLLLVPDSGPLAQAVPPCGLDVPGLVEIADLTPAPVAERLRAAIVLAGWFAAVTGEDYVRAALTLADRSPIETLLQLGSGWSVLRLEVGEVLVRDDRGTRTVQPEEYSAATVDPVRLAEPELLEQLNGPCAGQMRRLTELLGLHLPADLPLLSGPPVPVGVDRHGLRLRLHAPDRAVDVQVPWVEPLEQPGGLRWSLTALIAQCANCRISRSIPF